MNFRAQSVFLLITFLFLSVSCLKQERINFYLGGIHVDEPDFKSYVRTLKSQSFNTVELTVYAKQGDWDSDNFWHNGVDSNIIDQIKVAKAEGLSVALILRVALDHAFERNQFLWHGMIMPRSDSLLKSWFKKYEEFVTVWSVVAAEQGVELLVIGSEMRELVATEQLEDSIMKAEFCEYFLWQEKHKGLILKYEDSIQEKHLWVRGRDNFKDLRDFLNQKSERNQKWAKTIYFEEIPGQLDLLNERRALQDSLWRGLIRGSRALYDGKITYAANFDNYDRITFWDELDLMGVNAYFKLRLPDTVHVEPEQMEIEFDSAWYEHIAMIDTFQQNQNNLQPVIFTELGYTFRKNCSIAPWAHDEFSVIEFADTNSLMIWYEEPKDFTERALAISSLHNVLESYPRQKMLKGILYWKLSTKREHENIEDFLLWIDQESKDPLIDELKAFNYE